VSARDSFNGEQRWGRVYYRIRAEESPAAVAVAVANQ
jgi:hypothetical protein